MPNMSDYAEQFILNCVFRGAGLPNLSGMAIALGTGTIPANASGTLAGYEIPLYGGYQRVVVGPVSSNWNAVAYQGGGGSGYTQNTLSISFPQATANWSGAQVVSVAICDTGAWNGGNMLFAGNLTVPRTVLNGDTLSLSAGNLQIFLE